MIFVNDNNPPGARGMARYFQHTVTGVIDHFGDRVVVFSRQNQDYHPARHIRAMRFKGSEQIGLHDMLTRVVVRRLRPKVIYNAWFNNVRTAIPQVVVVYDLIFELFPQYHSRWRVPLRNLALERKRSFEQADALIAISHSAAKDIIKIYPRIDASKIIVTHLGVAPSFFNSDAAQIRVSHKPYFLYVGFRTGHKNFKRLLIAYGQSGLANIYDLRVISSASFDAQELERIQQYKLQDSIHLISGVSDIELRQNYAGAVALVYPSEYEGFGLPILEAMASGTLVVTSSISSMPEIGGDVAFYFDPYDVDSIAEGLKQVDTLSSADRSNRIAAGVAHARAFTWERCQQQTIEVIEKLVI